MTMYLVIALLAVIVLLLCVPLKKRIRLLRALTGVAVFAFAAYYLGPQFVALIVAGCQYTWEHFGWRGTLGMVAVSACLFIFSLMFRDWRLDRRDNAAIRSGSVEAFNRRVARYKQDPFNYDHAKAVETAIRIREEK